MKKYLTVFSVAWQNGFVYRLNFILWRVRSVIVILTTYFLWNALFQNNHLLFGYTKQMMLTYIFLTLVLRSIIMGMRSIDTAGEIQDGKLSNYLVRPINYHIFWFTRDLADKLLNIIFSIFEISVLFFVLHPPIYLQLNPILLAGFGMTVILGIMVNFLLGNIASNFSFWLPGNGWGFWFIYLVFQELLGGVMFPLDILPKALYRIVMLLPFPYLLYFPVNVFLGKIQGLDLVQGFVVAAFWTVALTFIIKFEWNKGLVLYQSEGR